jgi:LmbE family N-acetylglucosaminyl deacetylase
MTEPTTKIALAFLAHPDDAEILCAGTLVRLAELRWEIHIATATAGDLGTETETPWAISARRTEEARRSAQLLGATYHCLDERDCLVVCDKPTIKKAIDLFRRVAPSLVFTHAPADYMLDHEETSRLARAASFIYAGPNASLFPLREGSRIPWLYYCDPLEGIDPLGRPVEPSVYVDISATMERKTAMLACHESQRAWLRAHHGMDEYIDAMQRFAAMRGEQLGAEYAEAFIQHRGHAYPQEDLLAHLLGGGA